jgi:hypothetical protein
MTAMVAIKMATKVAITIIQSSLGFERIIPIIQVIVEHRIPMTTRRKEVCFSDEERKGPITKDAKRIFDRSKNMSAIFSRCLLCKPFSIEYESY